MAAVSNEYTNLTDAEIIELFKKNNDLVAYDALILRHSERLYNVSFGLLGNAQDAEEVVQDAFLRAYRAMDKFRGDSSFLTWIQRIVINLSRNKYQWNKRRGCDVNVSISDHLILVS